MTPPAPERNAAYRQHRSLRCLHAVSLVDTAMRKQSDAEGELPGSPLRFSVEFATSANRLELCAQLALREFLILGIRGRIALPVYDRAVWRSLWLMPSYPVSFAAKVDGAVSVACASGFAHGLGTSGGPNCN